MINVHSPNLNAAPLAWSKHIHHHRGRRSHPRPRQSHQVPIGIDPEADQRRACKGVGLHADAFDSVELVVATSARAAEGANEKTFAPLVAVTGADQPGPCGDTASGQHSKPSVLYTKLA